jgi:hypothetical protein
MEIDNPEEFATFLYNQQQKQNLLQQDIQIQSEGIEHELGQWHKVLSHYESSGDNSKINTIKQEINGLFLEHQNCADASERVQSVNLILRELKALPEVREPYLRIESAQETLNDGWRLKE